jgi:hypothetical protein
MKVHLHGDDCTVRRLVVFVMSVAFLVAIPAPATAQQAPTEKNAALAASSGKEFVEEWVYRVQYGRKDEWFRIFRKYQLAILEKQKQLGFVKQYTVWAPGLHTSEESRWDYRVIIVRAADEAPPGQSEDEIARQLFPDQAAFKQDENRRWELTANHWDLPIHAVNLSAPE